MAWKRLAGLMLFLALGAKARAQDWSDVQHLKRGTQILVQTTPDAGSPGFGIPPGPICRVETIDADILTCKPFAKGGPRWVYAARAVTAVYRVRRKSGWLALTVVAASVTIAAGLATVAAPAVAAGFVVLLGCGVVAWVENTHDFFERVHGTLTPLPSGDKLELVYYRGFTP